MQCSSLKSVDWFHLFLTFFFAGSILLAPDYDPSFYLVFKVEVILWIAPAGGEVTG